MKFYPHGSSGRDQTMVTFDTVRDHITDYIQKSYNYGIDMVNSITERCNLLT